MWNDHLYAGASLYRTVHLGGPQPLTGDGFAFNIDGAAPYWRVAWQQSWGLNYLEVGTYGIYVSSVPGGVTGLRDTYADPSLDLQYERPFGVNLLTVHATYIHETSNLNATFAAGGAAESAHHLNTFKVGRHLPSAEPLYVHACGVLHQRQWGSTALCTRTDNRQRAGQPE